MRPSRGWKSGFMLLLLSRGRMRSSLFFRLVLSYLLLPSVFRSALLARRVEVVVEAVVLNAVRDGC